MLADFSDFGIGIKGLRAAATHHLPSLAHPHHRLCVPKIRSAEGEAERREGGREAG